jgi:hypothetical protein
LFFGLKKVNITYIDQTSEENSPGIRMLRAGIDSYHGKSPKETITLDFATFDQVDKEFRITKSNPEMVFINLIEPFSHRDQSKRITPGRSLEAVQHLLRNKPAVKVFFIVPPGLTITGIDLAACLLSDISGVLDERSIVMEDVLTRSFLHKSKVRQNRRLLLIGTSCDRIHSTKSMVSEWQDDSAVEPKHDFGIWRTAIALAQLEKLEPMIGSGHLTSFTTLATTLNLARHLTSFYMNSDDLRRILGVLARRWLDEDSPPVDRFRLPEFARKHGFPKLPPAVINENENEAERQIYETLQNLEIKSTDVVAGMPCCVVERQS